MNSSATTYQPVQSVVYEEDVISLQEIVNSLWRGKWIIIASVIIWLCFAVGYVKLNKPIYQSNALIKIEHSQETLLMKLLGVSDVNLLVPNIEEAKARIQSYEFIAKLLEQQAGHKPKQKDVVDIH